MSENNPDLLTMNCKYQALVFEADAYYYTHEYKKAEVSTMYECSGLNPCPIEILQNRFVKKLPAQIQILGLRPRAAASIEGVSARAHMQNQGLNRPWRTG